MGCVLRSERRLWRILWGLLILGPIVLGFALYSYKHGMAKVRFIERTSFFNRPITSRQPDHIVHAEPRYSFDWLPDKAADWLSKASSDAQIVSLQPGTVAMFHEACEHFDRIRELSTSGTGLCDDDLKLLRKLDSLDQLRLAERGITDAGIEHIATVESITSLILRAPITDVGVDRLSTLTNLQSLMLSGGRFTDRSVECIARLPKLATLSIRSDLLSDESLRVLASMSALESIDISSPHFTDAGIAYLGQKHNLKALSVSGPVLTDKSVEAIAGLTQLQSLDLSRQAITDASAAHIGRMTQLRYLNLELTDITDEGFARLKGLKELQDLRLRNTYITAASVEYLKRFIKLKYAVVPEEGFTEADVEQIRQAIGQGATIERGRLVPHPLNVRRRAR